MRTKRGALSVWPVDVFTMLSPRRSVPRYTRMYVSWPKRPCSSLNASAAPARNSTLTRSAACTCGRSDHQPRLIAGRSGATGWMKGLPKKNASPVPSSISAMPMAMSLTRGSEQSNPWTSPKIAPASAAASTPIQADPVRKASA